MATKMRPVTFHVDKEIDDMIYAMRRFPKFYRCSKSEIVRQLIISGLEAAEQESTGNKKEVTP